MGGVPPTYNKCSRLHQKDNQYVLGLKLSTPADHADLPRHSGPTQFKSFREYTAFGQIVLRVSNQSLRYVMLTYHADSGDTTKYYMSDEAVT